MPGRARGNGEDKAPPRAFPSSPDAMDALRHRTAGGFLFLGDRCDRLTASIMARIYATRIEAGPR